jgi:hypothetical protein
MSDESENRIEPSKADEGVNVSQVEKSATAPVINLEAYRDDRHINLTWRSWMVVLYAYLCSPVIWLRLIALIV